MRYGQKEKRKEKELLLQRADRYMFIEYEVSKESISERSKVFKNRMNRGNIFGLRKCQECSLRWAPRCPLHQAIISDDAAEFLARCGHDEVNN